MTCDALRLLVPSALDMWSRVCATMVAGDATHDNKPGAPSWKGYDAGLLVAKATHHLAAAAMEALGIPKAWQERAHAELLVSWRCGAICLATRPFDGKEGGEDSLAHLVADALFLNDLLLRGKEKS